MHFMPRRTFLHRTAALLGGALAVSAAPAAGQRCRRRKRTSSAPFIASVHRFKRGWPGPTSRGIADPDWYRAQLGLPDSVPGALIEVWQANHAGMYDAAKPGNFTEGGAFHLRGMLYTNERGQYEIDTIVPGRYPIPPNLPGSRSTRADETGAHSLPSDRVLHVPITTQLYFKGDPFIAGDPGRPQARPGRRPQARRAAQRGVFDFVLTRGL